MVLFDILPHWLVLLGAALLIGGLVGLEQESSHHRDDSNYGGIRTFPMISLMGFAAAYFFSSIVFLCVVFTAFALFIVVGYVHDSFVLSRRGITTEVAGLFTFILGAAVARGYVVESVTVAILITLMLSAKDFLHELVYRHIEKKDILAVLKFLVVTMVLYPLLPDKAYTFLKINPKSVWLMVVLISSISFAAYFATKIFGTKKGILVTSLLGGLVSSTAVTLAFAKRSKEAPQLSRDLALGIVLASTIMFVRQFFILFFIYPRIGIYFAFFAAFMFATGLVMVLRSRIKRREEVQVSFSNPYELSYAFMFGVFYTFILVISKLAHNYLGSLGVYFVGFVSGIADVDPVTITMAQLSKSHELGIDVALVAVMISSITNTATKAVFATIFGSKELYHNLWKAFFVLILLGLIIAVLTNRFI